MVVRELETSKVREKRWSGERGYGEDESRRADLTEEHRHNDYVACRVKKNFTRNASCVVAVVAKLARHMASHTAQRGTSTSAVTAW